MKVLNFLFFVFLSLFISGCFEFGANSSKAEDADLSIQADSTHSGMMYVLAQNFQVTLGTKNSSAHANERPQMTVDFDYSFSIGKHEVTCEEFNAYSKMQMECAGDSLPVTNVNYYDAVLFANERSKAEGLDTAYTYTLASFDANNSCLLLENFSFRADVDAYRLPTEAEWVLVASQNWNPSLGWNSENSDYAAHTVCSANTSATICDMEGNVKEWINDWIGYLKDTVVSNYMGSTDGGLLGQRILKGGSFRDNPESIKIYNRGDVYTVTAATKAEYTGFRLAYGKIENPTWLNSQGTASSSLFRSLISTAIKSLTGTNKSKLVFRNDISGNLVYVDYSLGNILFKEIQDSIDCYHPVISPDGSKIAFCTKPEGISGKSELYVRNLDETGSNLVKLDVESAAIPRWKILASGDTVIDYVDDAGNNHEDATFQKHSLWQVPFSNGKFGTPEKLLSGNYHGGFDEKTDFAISGARVLRAHINGKDTIWYAGEQACNASLSTEGLRKTLFLDFASSTGQEFSKASYQVHERLLIADSNGKLIQSIPAPNHYSYDHTEWTSLPNFAIATLTNTNTGAHEKIALVNILDSSVTDLVEGDEIWHPDFWVNPKSIGKDTFALDCDSAGLYFRADPANEFVASSVELGFKIKDFWAKHESVEAVTLGSSMLLDAVISDSIHSYSTLNMCVILSDIYVHHYLLQHYLLPYAPKLKVVVLELSPGLLFRDSYFFNKLINYSPGILYDENHLDSTTKNLIAEASQEIDYPTTYFGQDYLEDEFLLPSISWGDFYIAVDTSQMPLTHSYLKTTLSLFHSIKKQTDSLGIVLIAAITPRNPDYRNTGSFGCFGPSRTNAAAIIDSIAKMGIPIFDENKNGLHDYSDDMAYNSTHLSYLGARQFSARLDSVLRTLETFQ